MIKNSKIELAYQEKYNIPAAYLKIKGVSGVFWYNPKDDKVFYQNLDHPQVRPTKGQLKLAYECMKKLCQGK